MEQENMKSLVKTFDILDLFLHGEEEISATEISRRLNLNKTTVSRIMLKLVKRGYLKQIEKRGKYSLGTIFLEFSVMIKTRLKVRDAAIPYLVDLSRKVNECIMLSVWDKGECIISETFHDNITLASPLKVVPDEGSNMPLNCTCVGKIFLANMTNDELSAYFNRVTLEPRTPNTRIDPDAITRQLVEIRQDKVAFDDEEYSLGVRGIASGIFDSEGKMAGAIGILAPSVRFTIEEIRKFTPLIKSYAHDISHQMGYRGDMI
jgi:IclR family transcriptional regulator, KDG regulon repressor